MKTIFAFIALATILYSCTKDNLTGTNSGGQSSIIQTRSECDSVVYARILANENYSIIVTTCYVYGQVVDVDYQIDESESGDKIAMLDLSGNAATRRVELINNTISSLGATPIISNSYASVGGTEYSCECNDEVSTVNDCVKRTYKSTLKYCDELFHCTACSVVVEFADSGNNRHVVQATSVVIVPNNL